MQVAGKGLKKIKLVRELGKNIVCNRMILWHMCSRFTLNITWIYLHTTKETHVSTSFRLPYIQLWQLYYLAINT